MGWGVGPGLTQAIGTPALRFVGSLGWTPGLERPGAAITPTTDTDGDGIPDIYDACPYAYGPKSDDPKHNGCPVVDDDEDGIPNWRGRLPPGVRAPHQRSEDERLPAEEARPSPAVERKPRASRADLTPPTPLSLACSRSSSWLRRGGSQKRRAFSSEPPSPNAVPSRGTREGTARERGVGG